MVEEHTIRSDWLNDYLSKNESCLVSGHPSLTKNLDISLPATITLRFIGNKMIGYEFFLVVDSNKTNWDKISTELILSQNYKKLMCLFKEKIRVLFFDSVLQEFGILDKNLKVYDTEELINYFSQINSDFVHNAGVRKSVNRSTNDFFQDWTRRYLSIYLTINDIDSISINKRIIFELKRVKSDLSFWKPYLDDISNYKALEYIFLNMGLRYQVIAYHIEDTKIIALHNIIQISKEEIKGESALISPTDLSGDVKLKFIPYASRNTREYSRLT